ILSRCQEFEFRTIPLQKIFDRLKLIAVAEKIDISDDALRELARSGEGSMRDAQSNFDQVISFSSDKISAADVTNALGFAGVEILTKTINAISEREPKAILSVVDDIIGRGHDLRNFCRDLLGLFRDLLVFKVAGGDKHLFEGAVFSAEELGAMAVSFGEADLLRFFNSLCETEASLREAAHPRYVLEVGLVKLIEMRKVSTIESILERLDAISSGVPLPAKPQASSAATASSDASPEKKTLKIDAPAPPSVTETFDEPPHDWAPEPVHDEIAFDDLPAAPPPIAKVPVIQQFTPPQIRLPRLSAEELEHIDDTRLDDAYETKLMLSGDDLMPINGSDKLVTELLGEVYIPPTRVSRPLTTNGSSAAAVVPAFDVAKLRAEIAPEEEAIEVPILGPDPTEDELIAYARALPSVRAAIRVFRGKIVEVKKTSK
ncbi:MAG: hypothetical protein ABJB40_12515, partial [Acidobacteriota bacterium]